jgi:iron complex outermembrane recepter protein
MRRSELTAGPRRPLAAVRPRGVPQPMRLPLASAIAAILAGAVPAAHAAEPESNTLEEVTVTAQKVTENLQNVPVSIETLGTAKLEQLNITNMDQYVQYLSGLTTIKSIGQGGNGIGTTHVYMRGINAGQDGNHSGSQPTVGTYYDEQPVTTIDGTVDVHVYDIARVEVLEGPQGTLYGASSEAGTIRIITNKPDPTQFSAGYDVSGQFIFNGGQGATVEGYVNIPINPQLAVRLVGWDEHDPGYINNVAGTNVNAGIVNGQRTFPTWSAANNGETLSSSPSNNYNTSQYQGGRAALKWDIDSDWSVMPTFMGQRTAATGFFSYDPGVGTLELTHFGPENSQDSFTQTALTVLGKVHDFEITYAGAWFVRNQHSIADYADYSYFYDKYAGSGAYWKGNNGQPIEPQEFVIENNHYTKWSNELRVNTPQQLPVHATVGLFAQRQTHEIWEDYVMPGLGGNPYTYNPQGLAQQYTIPGLANNSIWLTDQERVDRDSAAFVQANWEITSHWEVTGGIRQYHYDNTLQGFYGYSAAYGESFGGAPGVTSGQLNCGPPGGPYGQVNYAPFHFAPCTDLNLTSVTGNGHTELGRVTYKIDPDHLVYATYSTGFRPGGVNRVYDAALHSIYPPYQADQLKNYEIGWKTQWLDDRLRWNGAVFYEDWKDFQFAFLGPNSVTVVQNAPSAASKGVETNIEFRVTPQWTLSGSATYLDAKLTEAYCGAYIPNTTQLTTNCPTQINGPSGTPSYRFHDGTVTVGPLAPNGTRLPGTPRLKLNLINRYTYDLGDWKGFSQVAYVYQDSSTPLLFPAFYTTYNSTQPHLGELSPYSLVDLATGAERDGMQVTFRVSNVFDNIGQLTKFAACTPTTCTQPYISPTQPRTFWLQLGQKF